MQEDEAAFESWAIALKYYLKEHIDTITIDWERDFTNGEGGILHYHRFVYRLAKFVQTYFWARSEKPIPALFTGSSITELIYSICFLDAISGTTPPYSLCNSI